MCYDAVDPGQHMWLLPTHAGTDWLIRHRMYLPGLPSREVCPAGIIKLFAGSRTIINADREEVG